MTDGALRLMARTGTAGVTLRALGDDFKVTPQAVRQWFGGTERMWAEIAMRWGHRWIGSLSDYERRDPEPGSSPLPGPHHLIPFDADDIAATRAWLALLQLGRDDPAIGELTSTWEQREVEVVGRLAERVDLVVDGLDRDLLVAVVRGLRHSVSAGTRPMSLARAHRILDRALSVFPRSPVASVDQRLF